MAAAASSTRAALRVATSGRKRPVASANPATVPEASAAGVAATLNTVPEVPIETMTSPSTAPTPERGGRVVAGARAEDRAAR
jgi:hypothetical protein